MSALNGFDPIARIYDAMDRIAFGRSAKAAQVNFITEIPDGSQVLVLGGGTGWILTQLLGTGKSLQIWYIDASKKMIQQSRLKTTHASNIHFIHGTESDIPPDVKFDVVITFFFLDLFSDPVLDQVTQKIKHNLKEKSLWLAADFIYQNKWWQKLMLTAMYTIIHALCKIEARRLPDWRQAIANEGFNKRKSKSFFGGFIESGVYSAF